MDRIYFEEYYRLERENWWFRVRANIIFEHIEKLIGTKKDIKILNVGAATGHTSKLLEKYGEVTSIEYDKDCFEFTKEKLNINILNASATELPFESHSFDLVCAFDVIEHIEEDAQAVSEMCRVCKKEGFVSITVPAFMLLWGQHDVINHHYRRYVLDGLQALFKNQQGKKVWNTYFSTFLFPPLFLFRLLSRVAPNLGRKGAGSDFSAVSQSSLASKLLYHIFKIEQLWVRKFKFPFGSSLLFSWQKTA